MCIIIISSFFVAYLNINNKTKDKDLYIHYIDVGQGDSILIQFNNKNLLFDSGPTGCKVNSYLKSQGIKKIDYVVATHPHEDHIGEMSTIINRYNIGKFYAPKKVSNSKTFEDMIKALKNKNLKINVATAGIALNLGNNIKCEIIAPNSKDYKDVNNYSAVIKITYGNTKFLFTGDAEKLSENEILDKDFDISCDVLKIGHHGSKSSTSDEFLNKSNPKIAIISCGKDNNYNHPNTAVINKLKEKNIKVYRTDVEGTIVLKSDGSNIKKLNKKISRFN